MNPDDPPEDLESLLQCLERAGKDGEAVTIEAMLEATDQRGFGALLLIPGLLVLSPLSGIPGLPSALAVMVALIAVQLLLGRRHFWLPLWLIKRSVSRGKYDKALGALHLLARYVDRVLRHRLTFLTHGALAVRINALICLLLALTMPPLEIIPFGNSIAGAALTLLGLGLMARDGAMILFSYAFLAGLVYLVSRIWL